MAKRMFFSPSNLTLLKDAQYSFSDPDLSGAGHTLISNLKSLDRTLKRRFIPLDEISASIQY
jgi:hypothetical protein